MIRTLVILALVVALPVFANHVPIPPEEVIEGVGRTQVTLNLGAFDPLLEVQARLEDAGHELRYRSLTAGGYYRLHKNLKAGAFYRLQWGARHDDDWVEPTPTWWSWQDTRDRLEQVLIFDLSPRFQLDFLPGKDWVLMLKSRYLFNAWNRQHSLLFRPELTYFLLVDRRPLLNFSLAYGLYFPLNFGESLLYEHEPYLAVLYHLSPGVQLELSGACKTVNWSTSREVIVAGDSHYQVSYRAWVIGAGVLFNLAAPVRRTSR